MQESRVIRIWKIFYPIGVYFVVTNVLMVLFEMFVKNTNETYMLRQTLASLLAIPVLYQIYHMDQLYYYPAESRELLLHRLKEPGTIKRAIGMALAAIFASMALNNLIALSGLLQVSDSYQQVAEAFYGGGIFWEVAGTCVAAPILEEILYRGILYQRMKTWYGKVPGILASAFLFGLMHMNLVQFLYAFLLGILLALFLEKAGHLYGAILGHMAANLIAVVRTETGFLHGVEQNRLLFFGSTLLLILLAVFFIRLVFAEGHDGSKEGFDKK